MSTSPIGTAAPPAATDPSPRRRRRGERLEAAIFSAVWEELATVGYLKLTMDGVASRAQTSKPVLYRRWSSRAELVLAALSDRSPADEEIADTGDLRTDLITLLYRLAHRYDHVPGDVLMGLMSETFHDREAFDAFRAKIAHAEPEKLLASALDHAARRGEIGAGELPTRVARVPFDLLRNESLIYGLPTEDKVTAIVDEVVLPLIRVYRPR